MPGGVRLPYAGDQSIYEKIGGPNAASAKPVNHSIAKSIASITLACTAGSTLMGQNLQKNRDRLILNIEY
jgi:hypothetical protein